MRTSWQRAQEAEQEYWNEQVRDAGAFIHRLCGFQQALDFLYEAAPDIREPSERLNAIEIGVGPFRIGVISLLYPTDRWTRTYVEPLPPLRPVLCEPLMRFYDACQEDVVQSQAPAEKVSLKENSFDLAVCYNVLDHTLKYMQILARIHALLRPAGHILLGLDGISFLGNLRWRLWTSHFRADTSLVLQHPVRFTASQVMSLLPSAGFELVRASRHPKGVLGRIMGRTWRYLQVGRKTRQAADRRPGYPVYA